ncbi:aminodeoxychorismate synthase component I [Kaarinaea lacus]
MSADQPIVVRPVDKSFDLLALHELNSARYPYLLQTVAQTSQQVHFDILFACPQQTLALASTGELSRIAGNEVTAKSIENSEFLNTFENLWRQEQISSGNASDLPFRGGWFLYLGYELAQQIEPSLALPKTGNSDLPVAFATRIPAAIIVNRSTGQCFAIAEPGYEDACLSEILQDIATIAESDQAREYEVESSNSIIKAIYEEPEEKYLSSVRRIKHYIKEGDVFQVNLSREWNAELTPAVSPAQLYRRLTQTNPAPFFALAVYHEHAIISSSPERLVKVNGDQVETRPIAGTRPRGDNQAHDDANLQELIGHPKERAEHIMLIDLERNDLGRVCVPGSVKVNELMVLETYAHVHHIVSNVQGTLHSTCTPSEVIKAVFPGGTITGCPKVRCMEIIAELEHVPRGAYTGSLGYVNHDGSMDLNILIRTLVKNGNHLTLRAGAGIVADSDPENELEETRAKAKGLLLAL